MSITSFYPNMLWFFELKLIFLDLARVFHPAPYTATTVRATLRDKS